MFNSSANKFWFKKIKENPSYIFISLILSLSSAIFNVIGTILLIPILAILFKDYAHLATSNYPIYIKYFFTLFAYGETERQFIMIVFTMSLLFIFKIIANYINTMIGFKYTKYLVYKMKTQGLNLLCRVDLDYYHKNKATDILLKLNREIEKAALAIKSIQNILVISFILVLVCLVLISISWQLTLINITLLLLTFYLNNLLVFVFNQNKSSTPENFSLSRQIVEFITGIRSIKIAANEYTEYIAIAKSIKEKDRTQLHAQLISTINKTITEIAVIIMVLFLIIVSFYIRSQPIQEFAYFLVYLVILLGVLPVVRQFNQTRLQLINTRSSVVTVANFLTEANKPILSSGNIAFSKLQTGIELQQVTFAYPQHAQIVLDKINLRIPLGKTIAVVGSTGAGKSTLADLLIRFYDPIEGKILLDGIELKKYDLVKLRRAIAVVSRNTFLFSNSLAYNIAYGVKNATQAEIIDAAKKARIYQFICQLPQGLATPVGEGGVMLSDEQKQKISLARAFLRNPEILILDEPSNLLDRNSNLPDSIQSVIESLYCDRGALKDLRLEARPWAAPNRTILIMTKQLKLAQHADQIVVLNKGRIIEIGTHAELLKQSNVYQRLYSMQFKTDQQSRQQKLTQKIAQKLAQHTNSNLSSEVRTNLNALLDCLQLINEGLFENQQEQNKLLDETYQSAKNMLVSLKEYERKISREFEQDNL